MKKLLLTFDLEEFPAEEFGIKLSEKEKFEISRKGLVKIINLLYRLNIKSTFFTTLEFAQHYPALIKKLIKEGNEIALHAYSHKHRYNKMPEKVAYNYIKTAKKRIEKMFKIKISGFRAPQMSFPSYSVLKKAGLKYDSSLHPTYIPGYYNRFFDKRKPFSEEGITIMPISVTPVIRLPFSWVWFRNMPLIYSKFCTSFSLLDSDYINIYFHPWEFVELNKFNISKMIKRNTGNQNIIKLNKYLNWISKKTEAITINNFLK